MRKKAHIAIREGKKIRNVYVMPEEKEEIKNIKKEQGLRSLAQAYEVWKQVKETAEDDENTVQSDGGIADILHELSKDDPELEELVLKQSSEIVDLNKEIKDLRIAVATRDGTIKVLEREIQLLRAKLGYKPKKQNNEANQRRVNEYWPELAEELDDAKIY